MRRLPFFSVLMVFAATRAALPQFADESTKGPRPDKELTERWEIGMIVTAAEGPCQEIVGTTGLPVDWPEQQVTIVAEEYSPFVGSHTERMVGTVKQLVVTIPELPAGEEARAMLTVEIRRRSLLPPDDPSIFVKLSSKKLPKAIRTYLGPSPTIESQNGKIKALAKELAKKSAGKSDWERVETIYQWVRENVEHQDGKSQGAAHALKARVAEHEDLTALFIALCRASEVPARTVWVHRFCYPEFYLEDGEGQGYWFPCAVIGDPVFGGMPDHRPIWQKGDNFRTPNRPQAVRFIPNTLDGKGGNPQFKFIRQVVGGAPM